MVILHVFLMTASLVVTTSMVGMALLSYGTPAWLLKLNFIGTMTGIGFGFLLLLTQPLDIRCLLLVGYLAVFGLAHSFIRGRMSALSALDS